MLELSRTVRFCVNDPPDAVPVGRNSFSALPAMRGLGRYHEITVRCRGQADPRTGYFINIRDIDAAVRRHALPHLASLLTGQAPTSQIGLGGVLRRMLEMLQPTLAGTVAELTLHLTPMVAATIREDDTMHVLIRQQYEFSAAHRLHAESLSDEENHRVFGKCNNPAGHGHNYRVEVVVRSAIDAAGRTVEIDALDRIVDRAVIEELDHKHLNHDVPAFARLNPSVENIAVVVHGMLQPALAQAGLELAEVSVWETDKTVCTYRGPE